MGPISLDHVHYPIWITMRISGFVDSHGLRYRSGTEIGRKSPEQNWTTCNTPTTAHSCCSITAGSTSTTTLLATALRNLVDRRNGGCVPPERAPGRSGRVGEESEPTRKKRGEHCHRSLSELARSRLVQRAASTFRQRARWVSESLSGAYRDARSGRIGGGGRNERNEKS